MLVTVYLSLVQCSIRLYLPSLFRLMVRRSVIFPSHLSEQAQDLTYLHDQPNIELQSTSSWLRSSYSRSFLPIFLPTVHFVSDTKLLKGQRAPD